MATDPRGQWLALAPTATAPLFFALDASWWIGGGCALDLCLGTQTPQKRLGIAVLRREQDAVRSHLAAWDLQALQAGALTPWPTHERLAHDRTVVWGRTAAYLPWQLEIRVENTEAQEWVYAADERVRLPLQALGLETADGIPFLRPEVALLYLAGEPDGETPFDAGREPDVRAIAAKLTATGRSWLRDALAITQPGHCWITLLD